MRGQEFRARDKKVQKMTRDGLTEKNLTAGTEQRISGRLADVSFGREKTEDTAAGHRAKSRTQKTMRGDGVTRHFIVDEKSILFSTVSTPLRHLHFADRTLLSRKLCSQIKIFRLELCVQ